MAERGSVRDLLVQFNGQHVNLSPEDQEQRLSSREDHERRSRRLTRRTQHSLRAARPTIVDHDDEESVVDRHRSSKRRSTQTFSVSLVQDEIKRNSIVIDSRNKKFSIVTPKTGANKIIDKFVLAVGRKTYNLDKYLDALEGAIESEGPDCVDVFKAFSLMHLFFGLASADPHVQSGPDDVTSLTVPQARLLAMLLGCSDADLQLRVVTIVRQFLSLDAPPVSLILQYGMVPRFVELLETTTSAELQLELAW